MPVNGYSCVVQTRTHRVLDRRDRRWSRRLRRPPARRPAVALRAYAADVLWNDAWTGGARSCGRAPASTPTTPRSSCASPTAARPRARPTAPGRRSGSCAAATREGLPEAVLRQRPGARVGRGADVTAKAVPAMRLVGMVTPAPRVGRARRGCSADVSAEVHGALVVGGDGRGDRGRVGRVRLFTVQVDSSDPTGARSRCITENRELQRGRQPSMIPHPRGRRVTIPTSRTPGQGARRSRPRGLRSLALGKPSGSRRRSRRRLLSCCQSWATGDTSARLRDDLAFN